MYQIGRINNNEIYFNKFKLTFSDKTYFKMINILLIKLGVD